MIMIPLIRIVLRVEGLRLTSVDVCLHTESWNIKPTWSQQQQQQQWSLLLSERAALRNSEQLGPESHHREDFKSFTAEP